MLNIYPQIYLRIFFHAILAVVLITIIYMYTRDHLKEDSSRFTFLFALVLVLFLGLRPITGPGVGVYFGDTYNYNSVFEFISIGGHVEIWEDPLFGLLTEFSAKFLSAQAYFFILAALYVMPIYLACRNLANNQTFILSLIVVVSLLFMSGGVNGIRAGIGTSFLLLGYSYQGKKILKLILFSIAVGFHKSMLLPVGAYLVSTMYENYKVYLTFWFISIVLSQLFGGFWENFFASFALIGDERLTSYLTNEADPTVFSRVGFRWDFLLYSFLPILAAIIYINKLKYNKRIYLHLLNTYLITNSFWILVIRANFSNRFAALSWFLLPVLLILPLLDEEHFHKQRATIAGSILFSYAFTYYISFESLWRI